MQNWRKVWREGLAPLLSIKHLEALQMALLNDDQRLLQGATAVSTMGYPIEGACALGYCGWYGEGLENIADVENFFSWVCFECDNLMKETAVCRWFLNWYDDMPRDEMRRDLLKEVRLALLAKSEVAG